MKTNRRGWMTADALTGLFLLAALATMLAVAGNVRLRTARAAASQRASLAVAEQALSDLHAGRDVREGDPAAKVSVQHMGPWVEVTVTREGHRISLTGPAAAGGEK